MVLLDKMSLNVTIPVILLHGLGGFIGPELTKLSLYPMEKYLNANNYVNTHCISYPADSSTISESVDYVDNEIGKIANKENDQIIVICQSMGGVIAFNLHTKGWNIKTAVSIGSPLHGARLITKIEKTIYEWTPDYVFNYAVKVLKNKAHGELQVKEKQEEPPHDYRTISMAWFNTQFDGCVFTDETIINPEKHLHLPWADHRSVFLNPRLWYHVHNLLKEC